MSPHWLPGAVCIIHRGSIGKGVFRFRGEAVLPPGSLFIEREGGDPAQQRNLCIEEAYERLAAELGWVAMLDGDQVPEPHTIMDLLESRHPIVSAAVHSRHYPMPLVGYTHLQKPGDLRTGVSVEFHQLPAPCIAVGMGCTLITRNILDKMERPWFRLGEITADRLTEDLGFCLRAALETGVTPMMIPSPVGHRGEVIFWPSREGLMLSFPDRPDSWKIPFDVL